MLIMTTANVVHHFFFAVLRMGRKYIFQNFAEALNMHCSYKIFPSLGARIRRMAGTKWQNEGVGMGHIVGQIINTHNCEL